MTSTLPHRRLLPWTGMILVSALGAWGAVEFLRISKEHTFQGELETEARRRALEITSQTLNGNVMGSVASLGLVNQPVKRVARGELPLQDPGVLGTLGAVGKSYGANGVYIVNGEGVIQSCWYTVGVSLTGVDVAFRPYFKIAMKGRENVYAAIGTTTGLRSLYFAAPLYAEPSPDAPIIGATVARLGLERIDSVLQSWSGPALLLSPQHVTFAANRDIWVSRLAGEATPDQIAAIRALKQFGKTFETGAPERLPFTLGEATVRFEGHRYAVAQSAVQWNDPSGEWDVVLLGDLDALLPVAQQAQLGAAFLGIFLAAGALLLSVRSRLRQAREANRSAAEELKQYAHRLEAESAIKSCLSEVATDLQHAPSLGALTRRFLFHLAHRLGVEYGALYVLDKEHCLLLPAGGHGTRAEDLQPVAVGQGLVGQCAQDWSVIEVADAADHGVRIQWGAGEATPRQLLLLPIVQGNHLMGVLVLGALQPLEPEGRSLLEAMLPIVATNLEILERNLGTQRLAEQLQRQQDQLRETEAWYRGILESAPDGMVVVDDQGSIMLTNPKFDAMFGYEPGSLPGQKIEVLVPEALRARHVALRSGFMADGTLPALGSRNEGLTGLRRDGSCFAVDLALAKLPAMGGRGMCVCASVRDITERLAAVKALADERERLQNILDKSPVSIAFTTQGVIHFANPKFVDTFGAKAGDPSPELYANPTEREELLRLLKREGIVQEREIRMLDRHQQLRDMLVTYLPITFDDAEGILAWIMDITDRKRGETELQERMAELERFSRLTINREEKMILLKEEINGLLARVGEPTRYKIVE